MAMPHGSVEDEKRARSATRQHLPWMIGPQVWKGVTIDVDVQVLTGCLRPQRSRVERAQFERSLDDEAAGLEERREDVQAIKLGAAVHEVDYPSRSAANDRAEPRRLTIGLAPTAPARG